MQPFVSIYRNLRTGDYLVQPYTEGPVTWTAFGDPTTIQADRFSAEIVQAVIDNLSKFGKVRFNQNEAIRLNRGQQKAFQDQHLEVSVEGSETGEMLVRPLRRQNGGRVGLASDVMVIAEHEAPERLAAAILEAFDRAT